MIALDILKFNSAYRIIVFVDYEVRNLQHAHPEY